MLFRLPKASAKTPEGISRMFIMISLKEIKIPISRNFKPLSKKYNTIKGSKNLRFLRKP